MKKKTINVLVLSESSFHPLLSYGDKSLMIIMSILLRVYIWVVGFPKLESLGANIWALKVIEKVQKGRSNLKLQCCWLLRLGILKKVYIICQNFGNKWVDYGNWPNDASFAYEDRVLLVSKSNDSKWT